ncbi:cobyrinate a,c-diamide synthase [Hoyosella subflava]|uniref:Hydrogenobyrinate a,c-diamide synthase n=1 Tax=Hoyosella subflava (strain DSM 45089 / JCM 17490 / NBRC 109087 / DQS3-9A1) TaxID=443218 RepID=F6EIZ9_HOYSD|nr:Cobyrinic acid a,c-diamide synthase [Hoyosella subflava DQS3-9A1]
MTVPAVVLAAPSSGSGKTTLATGIMAALRASGLRVAPFKVGPDYIDPGYHSLATGRPGRNLDPVLTSPELVGPLFQHGSAGCDIAIVEGVMGLFDGRIGSAELAEGSTAQVAALLGAPVVLVVDVRGHSQSLAALLHGFATFDPRVRIAGVILNQVGSDRHEHVLREACDRAGMPVLGVVPRDGNVSLPSRHLGLVTAAEHGGAADAAIRAMGELARSCIDLPGLRQIARSAVLAEAWSPGGALGESSGAGYQRRPVIAVASGPAFTFRYAEHDELLRAAGADIAVFDPLSDGLPEGTTGIVLPGGFPELYAAALAENVALLSQVRDAAAAEVPIVAECAGLLYLSRKVDLYPMAGVIAADAVFGKRLVLGYRDAAALSDSVAFRAGERVTGHEFHRTHLLENERTDAAWGWRDHAGALVREGFVGNSVHASYLHTHPAGHPSSVARFVAAARAKQPVVESRPAIAP